jgi:medium-chain acyl-[acyl-carrier-protein] hydrolase
MTPHTPRWAVLPHPKPQARTRLLCLPYAGGGTRAFASWVAAAGPDLEICPVLLPGREERLGEPAASSMNALLPALAQGLEPFLDRRYAILGHSMGAMIAFALARHLAGRKAPVHLFLSACGPRRDPERPYWHTLSDSDLIVLLKTMNGTPQEFFNHPELVSLLLPMVRADFTLSETFEVPERERLAIPITAFAGTDDPDAPPSLVRPWRDHTTEDFSFHLMPGDHFFLHRAEPMLAAITKSLSGLGDPSPSCRR